MRQKEEEYDIPLNETFAVIWDYPDGRQGFLGMARERINKDEYLVDYLEPDPNDSSRKVWRNPKKSDEQVTRTIQIISCNVIGAWDLTVRKPRFLLNNCDVTQSLLQSLYIN